MRADQVPIKTEAGQRELAERALALGQRHRTVLLLVDGRRTLAEVLRLAVAAGVAREVVEDLLLRGLIEGPDAADARRGPSTDIELPLDIAPAADSNWMPATRSLLPESAWNPLDSVPPGSGLPRPIEEARQLMIKAVRREAPVAGAITVMKLKVARSREDLVGLLDDVERRLARSRQPIIVAQTMRHVRHLLTMVESTASVPGA